MSKWMLLVTMLFSAWLAASDEALQQQLNNGELQINSWVEPADAAVSQQVELIIEVATQRWFAGGTTIGNVEIDGVVVLKREKFATNSSRRENGQSIAVQNWTITLYPQRAGNYIVPPVPLTVTVAAASGESIRGTVYTEPQSFSASVPTSMQALSGWVAATELNVDGSWSGPLDSLQVGDALTRIVSINAEDTAAMMLPPIVIPEYEGASVYRELPEVIDKVNRGSYLASRYEQLTYVFEQAGSYIIPAIEYHWWDVPNQQLQTTIIDEQTIVVGGSSTVIEPDSLPSMSTSRTKLNVTALAKPLLIVAGVVALGFLLFALAKWRRKNSSTNVDKIDVEKAFHQACRNGQAKEAVNLMYLWLGEGMQEGQQGRLNNGGVNQAHQYSLRQLASFSPQHKEMILPIFNQLMQDFYSAAEQDNTQVDLANFANRVAAAIAELNLPIQRNSSLKLN